MINQIKLQSLINNLKKTSPVSLSIKITKGQFLFCYDEVAVLPSASLIKLFILGAAMDLVVQKKLNLKTKYSIPHSEFVLGSGVIKYSNTTIKLSLYELIYLMVVYSDNIAANCILKIISIDEVQQFIETIGANNTKIVAPMMNQNKGLGNNYTCANDIHLFMELITNSSREKNNQGYSGHCLKVLKKTNGTDKSMLQFLLSPLFFKLLFLSIKNNRKYLKYFFRAVLYKNRKRLAFSFPSQNIVASKSATGKSIFHDSCIFSTKPKTIMVVLAELNGADFTNPSSADYKLLHKFYSEIGVQTLTN